jgi:hypothetical protein
LSPYLPSWVPDWSGPIYEPIGDRHWLLVFRALKELGELGNEPNGILVRLRRWFGMLWRPKLEELAGILSLIGARVDEVEIVGRNWDEDSSTTLFLKEIKEAYRLSKLKNKAIYISKARRVEGVWRIPVVD